MTRVNPLCGRRGVWLRQLKPDCGENTLAEVLATMRNYGGYDLLCLKVADGLDYQGTFDATLPVNSLADIVAVRDLCHSQGIAFCPVVVPRGVQGETRVHGAIAAAIGCLMCDIENGAGFWDDAPITQVPFYVQAVRLTAPDAFLVNQPDPRDQQVSGFNANFNAVCAQHYIGWNYANWHDLNLEAQRYNWLAGLYPEMYVTLYGVDQIQEAGAFWKWAQPVASGFHVFSFGPMNGAQLQYFGALPAPLPTPEPLDGPPPQPPPNPQAVPDVKSALDRLHSAQRHYADGDTERQAGDTDLAVAITDLTVPDAEPTAKWVKPLENYTISQPYGPTDEPLEPAYAGYPHYHQGIDLAAPLGTPIVAVQDGIVVNTMDEGNIHYGKSVWFQADDQPGLTILHGHMSRVDVGTGQRLKQGHQLGLVGSTGASTGPHLHFAIERANEWVNPQDFIAL